ncbi:unnamed protein product [Gordionus sp. m RMFG-2023]|uniref:keratin-associated protein 5-4-like n=1 Tax=Gordionus sp. m RMFG-2023 TaxID=3053472 RepID=UPI0030E5310F
MQSHQGDKGAGQTCHGGKCPHSEKGANCPCPKCECPKNCCKCCKSDAKGEKCQKCCHDKGCHGCDNGCCHCCKKCCDEKACPPGQGKECSKCVGCGVCSNKEKCKGIDCQKAGCKA